MVLLECKNLDVGYGPDAIQKHLNFTIDKGEYFFITGENGTGKSTLLKTILGFMKPLSGTIEYSPYWSKKETGFLPQTTEIQKTFPATVKEIVLSGCQANLKLFPFYKKNDIELAMKNLEKLGVSSYLKKSFKELSGGQQQRVLLARTLCAAKSVLVLDEPAKGFDSEITQIMYSLIEDLNKNEGMTIITISHDLEAAQKYGSKILRLGKKGENEVIKC